MNIFRLHISARTQSRRQETLPLTLILSLSSRPNATIMVTIYVKREREINLKIHSEAARCYMGYLIYIYTPKYNSSWCMVGFWHWHIPTFIITDISPPWWDFVMVGICWVTKTTQMKMTMMLQMLEKWQWRLMTKRLQFISPNLKLSVLSCCWVIVQGKVNKPWVWVGCTWGSAYVEKGAEVMISDGDDQLHHHQRWRWWHGWSRGSSLEACFWIVV